MVPASHHPQASEPLAPERRGDTIVAPITCTGWAWRGAVRLSGPRAHEVVAEVSDRAGELLAPGVGHARLRLGGAVHLPVLVACWRGPGSFTGEDCAELHFSGSRALLGRVLAVMTGCPGVRLAEAGEFSARAFLHGRMKLEEAEGVAAMIRASTDAQLLSARRLASGEAGRGYEQVATEITTLLALVEAGVDFSDQEDVVAIAPGSLRERLSRLADRCWALAGGSGLVRSGLARVVLVGAPNAGKSTLFNTLLGRKRVVESATAGSTRDVIVERLDLASSLAHPCLAREIELADLPGLVGPDESVLQASNARPAAAAAQAAAREALGHADMLLWCDPTGRFVELEDARSPLAHGPIVVRVRTFADRPGSHGAPERAGIADIAVCGLDPGTRSRLAALIVARLAERAGAEGGREADASVLPRHRAALVAVRRAVLSALELVGPSAPGGGAARQDELVAECLRGALDAAGPLVGRIDADDVLGRIFSTFCVGK